MSLNGTRSVLLISLVVSGTVFALEDIPQEHIPVLYGHYKEAMENDLDTNTTSLRRIFKHNTEYKMHVKKLKEVNGFKRHNLVLRSEAGGKSLIYINNPVETKIPNAYLSLEEFKQLLTDRVKGQREKFKTHNKPKSLESITTRTTLKNLKDISATKTSTLNNRTSKKITQSYMIDKFNRPPIQNTKKLTKLEYKSTVSVTDNIISSNTANGNNTLEINANVTINNVENNVTTEVNRNVYFNDITTTNDTELNYTNIVENITPITLKTINLIEITTPEVELENTSLPDDSTTTKIENTIGVTKSKLIVETVTTTTTTIPTAITILSTQLTTTTRPTRRTLSRPLVFMGGYK